MGIDASSINKLMLAGTFSAYANPESSGTIGMHPDIPIERIRFVGNAAGSGARIELKSVECRELAESIARRASYGS